MVHERVGLWSYCINIAALDSWVVRKGIRSLYYKEVKKIFHPLKELGEVYMRCGEDLFSSLLIIYTYVIQYLSMHQLCSICFLVLCRSTAVQLLAFQPIFASPVHACR